jgi:hypothetical protein
LNRDRLHFSEHAGTLDDVAQLSDIAGPRGIREQPLGGEIDARNRLREAAAELANKRCGQVGNVVAPVPQRR